MPVGQGTSALTAWQQGKAGPGRFRAGQNTTTLRMLLPACIRSNALVDVGERHGVGDHRVDLDLAVHVPVDDLRHVGAAARAAEGGALPDPAGDELERPRRDLRRRPARRR